MNERSNPLRRIRAWLAVFILGLVLSGISAGPIETELRWLDAALHHVAIEPAARATRLLPWVDRVYDAVRTTNARYGFLAYGTDWLAFGHVAIAVAFIGPLIDPLRNKWVIIFGLIACAGVIPWALIAGAVRGIPVGWRLIDCSFGIFGAVPLALAMREIRAMERELA